MPLDAISADMAEHAKSPLTFGRRLIVSGGLLGWEIALFMIVNLLHRSPVRDWPVMQCGFHRATGLWCPGCGGTRCCLALSHLDFPAALRWNGALCLIFLLLPLIPFVPENWCNKKTLGAALLMWGIYLIYRNLA